MVAADGVSYEKSAIEDWFTRSDSSPMTGEPPQTLTTRLEILSVKLYTLFTYPENVV